MSDKNSLGYVSEPVKQVPIAYDVDVAIAGAGISGVFAALAAGRYGVSVVLIDRFGSLGGNIGPGMIVAGSIYEEIDETIPGGLPAIPEEFLRRVQELRGTRRESRANYAGIVSYLASKMAKEAGVELILSAYAADPIMEDGVVSGLFVETKSGRVAVRAKVVIDATGDADIASRAGAPIIHHVPPDPSLACIIRPPYLKEGYDLYNDSAISYYVGNVDLKKYEDFISSDITLDEEVEEWANRYSRFYPRGLAPALKESWEAGEFRTAWEIWEKLMIASQVLFEDCGGGVVSSSVLAYGSLDPTDMFHISKLESALREQAFETVDFMSKHAPGFENAYLMFTSPFYGTRGGPCIEGEYTLTAEDFFEGRKFDDVMYRNTHEALHGGDKSGFDIPYRVSLPRKVDGLLVTGRGTAYIRRGHDPSGMRHRGNMMALGNAVGTAAALAVREGVTPKKLDFRKLQKELLKQGFYLGDDSRLKELGLSRLEL